MQETRRAFQQTMRAEYVDAVEAILGARVVAFMSQIHVDPDMAVEVFVLEDGAAG